MSAWEEYTDGGNEDKERVNIYTEKFDSLSVVVFIFSL